MDCWGGAVPRVQASKTECLDACYYFVQIACVPSCLFVALSASATVCFLLCLAVSDKSGTAEPILRTILPDLTDGTLSDSLPFTVRLSAHVRPSDRRQPFMCVCLFPLPPVCCFS